MEIDVEYTRSMDAYNAVYYSYIDEYGKARFEKDTGPIQIFPIGDCVWRYRDGRRVIHKYISPNGTIEIVYNDEADSRDIIFPNGIKEMYMGDELFDTQNMVSF